jgi:alpha-L-rhamnosidase
LPGSNAGAVTESGKTLSADIKVNGVENGYVVVNVGSGEYHFEVPKITTLTSVINVDDYIGKYKTSGGMVDIIEIVAGEREAYCKSKNQQRRTSAGKR